ncbi:hypothetical protein U1Q18_041095 [Sarracenia purpurea var. burkii]
MFEVSREKKNSNLNVPPVGKPAVRPHCFERPVDRVRKCVRLGFLGERPLGVCFAGEKVMMNLKSWGSPGYRKQGKYGKDSLNRFHALSSPNFEDYDVCFPALSGASKTPIEDLSSSASNLRGASSTPVRDYDCAEEGRRLERLTVMALNRAKKGHSPLTQEQVNHLESWLARYRASKADSPNQRGAPKYLGVSASVPAMKIQIPAERDLAGIALVVSAVASENESLDGADEVSKAGDKREEDEGASLKADPDSLIKNDDESVQEEVTTEEEEESTDVFGEEGSVSGDEESEVVGDLGEEASPKPEQGIPPSSLPKELSLASDVTNGGPVEALKGDDEAAGSVREGSEVVNNSQPNPSVSGILIPCDKSVMDLPISAAVSGVKGCNPCVDSERKIQVEACVKPFDYACKVFDKMPTSFSKDISTFSISTIESSHLDEVEETFSAFEMNGDNRDVGPLFVLGDCIWFSFD